jgi:hypothetical protein
VNSCARSDVREQSVERRGRAQNTCPSLGNSELESNLHRSTFACVSANRLRQATQYIRKLFCWTYADPTRGIRNSKPPGQLTSSFNVPSPEVA